MPAVIAAGEPSRAGARAEATPGAPLLTVRDLVVTVRLGDRDVPAVRGVSFDLPAAGALALVGESGCGKSLTALAIARLLNEPRVRIAGGSVGFAGRDLAALGEPELCDLRGRAIGMVFQEPATALNPVLTVGAQVAEPLRRHLRLSRAAAWGRAVELLSRVGIPSPVERARAFPHQLSGGMKQRVIIAMALACQPALLIADEPTTALDVTVQAQILALLADLRRDLGLALLLISHDLGVVAESCDEVAVMYAGRVVERAPTASVLRAPRHPYTAGLLATLAALERGGGPDGLPDASDAPRARPRLREIPGLVPALGRAPAGCAFAERCERAAPECRAGEVPLVVVAPGHAVRCLHPIEVAS